MVIAYFPDFRNFEGNLAGDEIYALFVAHKKLPPCNFYYFFSRFYDTVKGPEPNFSSFYPAHYVARQFGLVQKIPRYGISLAEQNEKLMEVTDMDGFDELRRCWRAARDAFIFRSFAPTPVGSPDFVKWWGDYLALTRQDAFHVAAAKFIVPNHPEAIPTDGPFLEQSADAAAKALKKGKFYIISRFEQFYDVV